MSDRDEIVERMAIYAYALDAKDYDGIADCFEEDAWAEYKGFAEPLVGRDAIMAHMRKALGPLQATQHLFTNFIVRIEGDTAQLTADILAQHVREGTAGGDNFLSGGKYQVGLRKSAGAWKFQRIAAGSTWSVGGRAMLPSI